MDNSVDNLVDNPWNTEQGRIARIEAFRWLARGEGELADFARDVVAGRATARDLVTTPGLSDAALGAVRGAVEEWQALPDDERERLVAESDTAMRERIAGLVSSAVEHRKTTARRPEPPDDEPYERPVILVT
jgi:hypothetical protein